MSKKDEQKTIQLGDLPQYCTDEILNQLRHSAVCFTYPPGEREPFEQCGSGTLVRHGNHFGILTAAHVIRAMKKLKRSYVVVPRCGAGHLRIDHDAIELPHTPVPEIESDGPDIGFVRLSASAVDLLKSVFSFINLEYHAKLYEDEKLPPEHYVWVEMGYPKELGNVWRDEDKRTTTTQVYCLAATGTVDQIVERDGFDYFDSKVEYVHDSTLPASFAGVSGAGLWRVQLRQVRGEIRIKERFLAGVVFFEFRQEGRVSYIRSHGSKSIYEYVLPKFILSESA